MTQTVFAFLFAVTALGSFARAADPQPYRVEIASVGNDDMDDTLDATSDLKSLRDAAPVSPYGLIARARSDLDRLTTALESFGYYQGRVTIKINGMMMNSPDLGQALTALPQGRDASVAISFGLGPLYHLGRIDIDGDLPDAARGALGLAVGSPAVAGAVLAGGARLLTALQERGYAFAKVDPPVAYEAADTPVLDVRFHVETGPHVNFGEIKFRGLKRVHEPLLRSQMVLRTGAVYSASALDRARRDLLALGVFGQVSLQIGTAVDGTGGVPVTFRVRERLRHAIAVSAAYSSDLGGSSGVIWTDRNVFGNAEQLSIAASVINVGGSDTTGVGYDTSAKFLKPDFGRRDQSLQVTAGAINQFLQAYHQTARTTSVTLSRKISSTWSVSVGGATTDERITIVQENSTQNYTLLAMPLNVAYDSTALSSPLEDPRGGIRTSLSVTPTLALGHPNSTFITTQIKIAGYFDLNHLFAIDPGRTVLAARALAGLAQGAGQSSLPPDQRFYAGGSGTIRGYGYQKVGPQLADGTPLGDTAITAGGLELRQRFGRSLGAAVFVDAGQVSGSLKALPDAVRVGAGAGIRYFTPIGPIRFDVAVPVQRRAGDDAFEIYIGLGQAF